MKRIRGKRIYFLTYEDIQTVLLVAISNKKKQQETINKSPCYEKNKPKASNGRKPI